MKDNIMQIGRKEWLDALRALAMMLVVFGHQVQWWDGFFRYTSAIKVPLFFAISGYLFKLRDNNFSDFFVNLLKKLIIPYIILALVSAILTIPISGINNFWIAVYRIFSGDSYWFMPCLIVGEVVFFFLVNYLKNLWSLFWGCCLFFVMGYALKSFELLSFGVINIAFEIQLFLFLGFFIRKNEDYLSLVNLPIILFTGVLYVVLCFLSKILFDVSHFDIHLSQYYNLPYCLILIILGNLFLFLLGMKLKRAPRFLTYIGQNTLVLYMWASWGILFPRLLIRYMGIQIYEYSIVYGFVKFLSALVFCCICSYFLNKYLPFFVGKTKSSIKI